VSSFQGLLLVDKPKTWTSFDVVNYVRRQVATANGTKPKNTKVGHTGTLDPMATGLLVLLIGKEYTRRAGELSKLDKTYEVTMKLGETSTTADEEGEKTVVSDTVPTQKAVLEALERLQGQIMQVPPAFSAMKINGQRAYKLAREGKTVELEARPVTIHSSELTSYDYPYVKFTSRVSSGTYIRSLVVDLGELLKTGAYMSDLRRTSIGDFQLSEARKHDDPELLAHIFTKM
jgi:tRNA pseudouridine55 synthase